jgi:hypothetical protein
MAEGLDYTAAVGPVASNVIGCRDLLRLFEQELPQGGFDRGGHMKTSVVSAFMFVAAVSAVPVHAAPTCKPVVGSFEAQSVTDGCLAAPGLLCTSGRVWGGLQGTYFFTMASALPPTAVAPPTAAVPSALFFTGNSTVTLKDGRQAQGIDTGSLDLPALGGQGGFASLITFSGLLSGQIRLRGELDPVTGTTSGDYLGTICGL